VKKRIQVEGRDGTNCTKKHKSKKKHTEETHTIFIPDLPMPNISISMDVIKDLKAKLKTKYDYDLSQYKQANQKLLGIVDEKVSKEKHQLELQNSTALHKNYQLLEEKRQLLELPNCSLLSERE
jgi:hypothetical protein